MWSRYQAGAAQIPGLPVGHKLVGNPLRGPLAAATKGSMSKPRRVGDVVLDETNLDGARALDTDLHAPKAAQMMEGGFESPHVAKKRQVVEHFKRWNIVLYFVVWMFMLMVSDLWARWINMGVDIAMPDYSPGMRWMVLGIVNGVMVVVAIIVVIEMVERDSHHQKAKVEYCQAKGESPEHCVLHASSDLEHHTGLGGTAGGPPHDPSVTMNGRVRRRPPPHATTPRMGLGPVSAGAPPPPRPARPPAGRDLRTLISEAQQATTTAHHRSA